MSQGYGVDIYGLATYGYSQPADYSIAPFTAKQSAYGDIVLSWASPNTTSWKLMELVRSTYGYPNRPEDGIVLTTIYPGTIIRTYDDPGLDAGTIYYYSMFISIEAPTWNSASTYVLNQQVLYNGFYWTSIQNGNTNHIPAAGSAFWSPSDYVPTWYPAGFAASLALGDQGYTQRLYDRTPQPYKTNTSDTFSNTTIDNLSLYHYESLFGFGLDILKAQYDSYLNLNNVDTVSATSLDILGLQLGINTDYLSTPQQRRQRVKNAAVNYRIKGETQSIHNLIAELSGWDSDITYGPNVMNTADQTSFYHPSYDLWSSNTTYFVNNLIQYNGYNYKNLVQSVGQAQAPTGTNTNNTWWQVQSQVLDTTVNKNPRTNQYSTWSWHTNVVTSGSILGVMTSLPHPTDTAINNWNAIVSNQTVTGTYNILSLATLFTPSYSAVVNYEIDNFVLFTDGYYYKALKPSGPAKPHGAVAPNLDNSFWMPVYYTTSDTPNTVLDGNPIEQFPVWSATVSYVQDDYVEYFGRVYRAAQDNKNSLPTGSYYSNGSWTFIAPAQESLMQCSYTSMIASSTSATASYAFYFYDKQGNLVNNFAANYSVYNRGTVGVLANFIIDYSDLQGTTEANLINCVTQGRLSTSTWASTPATANLWKTNYGMASVDQTLASTTTYIYSLLSLASAPTAGRVGVTFATDYTDVTTKTHGIIFAFVDASNFWYATRKTLFKVVAGVESVVATWTRLSDGDRMIIDINTTSTTVYKYARDGAGTLATLALNVNGPTVVGKVGLIQKYSATGAL